MDLTEPVSTESATKAQRVRSMLGSLSPQELRRTAELVLQTEGVLAELRNDIQDVLWAGQGPVILERTRRAIAAALDIDDLVADPARFEALLDRWWILGTLNPFEGIFNETDTSTLAWDFGPGSTSRLLRKQIKRHVFDNPGDWNAERLFDEIGAFAATDRRFAGFIEDAVSHQAVIHEENQRRLVATMTPVLREANLELRQIDTDGGYPVFALTSAGTHLTRPKNVVFGSPRKPDLRVSDTVQSEIEIVDARGNLVFDDPIGPAGVRWCDLQAWWDRSHPGLDRAAAKKSLYNRMKQSLPRDSPPQRVLFEQYHTINSEQIQTLPVLFPEVWLHWDHKTVEQRGARALLGQRMDFLLLAPHNQRIVLEVDGVSHYTDEHNQPSPARYARNTQYDRDMQLRGYTVYRFGSAELRNDDQSTPMLTDFFQSMFGKHNIG